MPNLLHEAELGYDVGFERPGAAVLIQFKLGEDLQRFRRTNASTTVPDLDKPFWRFNVDTSEPDGQYDLLLKAERSDAEVYYVAPRFADWNEYAAAFQNEQVLDRSLLMRPSEIDDKLKTQSGPDGWHRIVYDVSRVYVCSEPVRVKEVEVLNFGDALRNRIEGRREPVSAALTRVLGSFDRRRDMRRPPPEAEPGTELGVWSISVDHERRLKRPQQLVAERAGRLERFRGIAKSESDAVFAALGVETWAAGSQPLAVTLD